MRHYINKTKVYRYQKLTCREESAALGDEKEESLAWHYDPRDFSLRPRELERDIRAGYSTARLKITRYTK